ncbi:MAG: GNAT superfamily N-acetyltransferase [Colwellia sp.]|jgi:GNAT superfamily N-acetyltransferase
MAPLLHADKGKGGFSVLYENDNWIGLIYLTEYKNAVFVHFFAIAEFQRSSGYGSKVLQALKDMYPQNRVVLNIEEIDAQKENYSQRVKRKSFYLTNGFSSSGYIVKEPGEQLEMLIQGGNISKQEIEGIYKNLLGEF